MLVIRYFRIGKKNQPSFKIVVTDQRMPIRGGRFVEEVGFSDPIKKKKHDKNPKEVVIGKKRGNKKGIF